MENGLMAKLTAQQGCIPAALCDPIPGACYIYPVPPDSKRPAIPTLKVGNRATKGLRNSSLDPEGVCCR